MKCFEFFFSIMQNVRVSSFMVQSLNQIEFLLEFWFETSFFVLFKFYLCKNVILFLFRIFIWERLRFFLL